MTNEDIENLLSEKEKFTVELDKKQIAVICVSLHSNIEEYKNVVDNYDIIEDLDKET